MNVALIKDGVVENVAIFDTLQIALDMRKDFGMDEMIEVPDEVVCNIGDLYQDNIFISIQPEAPVSVPISAPVSEEPAGPTEIDLLKVKVEALTEHNSFLEECIVELALALYE